MSLDFSKLSPSQYFILIRLAQGHTGDEIAQERSTTRRTVRNHVRDAKKALKTKLSTRKIIVKYYKFIYPDLKFGSESQATKGNGRLFSKGMLDTVVLNARGYSTQEIAERLKVTLVTVHTRLYKLRKEYDVKTNQGLAYLWLRKVNINFFVPDPIETRNIT